MHKHVGAVSIISLWPPLKASDRQIYMHVCVPHIHRSSLLHLKSGMQMCLHSFSPKHALPLQKHAAETPRACNKARAFVITGDPFPFKNGKRLKPNELTRVNCIKRRMFGAAVNIRHMLLRTKGPKGSMLCAASHFICPFTTQRHNRFSRAFISLD